MSVFPNPCFRLALVWFTLLPSLAGALTLDHEKETRATLSSVTATLNGHSELHLIGGGDPIPGSTIHLNSEDSWVFFHAVTPSSVVSNLLPRIRVNGAPAVADSNVRVVQHVAGAVVIPHPSDYRPLTVFTGPHLAGASAALSPYTAYGTVALGSFADNIRSFVLKRGYTATFATNQNGTGASRNFVAQDSDLEISVMPSGLDAAVSFVRVFPWRWTSKKGSGDVDPGALDATWHYNWSIDKNSTRNWEYVAIKQQPFWPSLSQNWQTRGVNHLLGFNEPDNPVEDAYQNLSPPGSVANAVARWPELLGTGLRVGAPAVTDGGVGWLFDFMNQADAAGHRVDYVPIHYYRSYANNNDPQGAANQMYNFLRNIHDVVQRPIWVTEFNNGANWTNDAHDPTTAQNRDVIEAMIQMMDDTPWIERYAIYSRVEWFRQTHYDQGGYTPMGEMYRDHVSPMAYLQQVPNTGSSGNAAYLFDGHLRDTLSGNNPLVYGTPKRVPGKHGEALSFDGTDDHLVLPGRLGDSGDFSFAGWVKWDGGENWQRIFDLGDGTTHSLFLTPKSGGNTLRFAIKVGGEEQQLNAPALTPGEWTHVAVTIAGDTGKLFVNGSLLDTNPAMTINPSQVGTETNYLGKSQWPDPLFAGQLDDIRFFNTALSDAEVTALATSAPPELVASPAVGGAVVGLPFTGDLATQLAAGSGPATFEKISGPAWLAVSEDGALFGVPSLADAGQNDLLVRAVATGGAMTTAAITVPVEAQDHVARYPFELSAQAAVGTAHANLAGNPGFAAGHTGYALNFDGFDDHAVLPPGLASGNEITVATWVRWNGGAAWQRVFDFGNGQNSYFFLTPRSGPNTLRAAIRNGGGEQFVETAQLASGVWTHVAVTLGPEGGKLYVNGSQVDSNAAMTIRPSDFRPATNYLGRSQFAPDPFFGGQLDELNIFRRALDETEINALRTGSAPTVTSDPLVLSAGNPGIAYEVEFGRSVSSGGVTFAKVGGPAWLTVEPDGRISGVPGDSDSGNPPFRVRATSSASPVLATDFTLRIPVAAPPDLRAHYEFDGDTIDSVGTSDATAHGSPGYAAGLFDPAIALDGSDKHVQLPAGIVSDLTDATFSVRFRWNGGPAWQRVFDFGNNTSQYLFLTPGSGAGTLRFGITLGGSGSQQFIETTAPPVGEWTHVAVVLEGNTGTLYVNGAPATTGSITLDPADVAPALNYLGKSQWPDPYFNGDIDDFRIIGRALDSAEVKSLAVPPPAVIVPPVAGYSDWAAALPFPAGEDDPGHDADGDGLPNVIEWLFGSDPLDAADGTVPPAEFLGEAETGLADGKTHLGYRARVLKERPGVTLIPEAAAELAGLGTPDSATRVHQAGPPVDDGDFEIFTWYHNVPLDEAVGGFMRLRVIHK